MWGLLPTAVDAQGRAVTNVSSSADADTSDRAAVSLAGLSAALYEDLDPLSPRALRASMSDSLMARMVRDSARAFEGSAGGGAYGEAEAAGVRKARTVRRPQPVPRPSVALKGVHIVQVAAGFAHSLAVSVDGAAFACGYNDNGQLGSGSRRNAADFEKVRSLGRNVVISVAAGQQHSLAATSDGKCFAWGLGVLGQLGTGPGHPVAYLPVQSRVPEPVMRVAAGSHHSVAVAESGRVYSWGHSEYGQHGAQTVGGDDLQRRAHFFEPRVQASLLEDDEEDQVMAVDVACSAHSTFALAKDGAVWAWGWNAFGVLGNGKIQRSARPQRVFALADRAALRVAAGANHAVAVVRPRGCHYSMQMDAVLSRADFADVVFIARGRVEMSAHRAIVGARSAYLRGLLQAAAGDPREADDEPLKLDVFQDDDPAVVRALLGFLYTHRVDVAVHKRKQLAEVASRVMNDELVAACEDPWRRRLRGAGTADEDASSIDSSFVQDMLRALTSAELTDVEFLWPSEREDEFESIPAHRAVLGQVEYFRGMFLGGFSEAGAEQQVSGRLVIPLQFMPRDGVTFTAFRRLLRWVYTGCFDLVLAPVDDDGEESGPEDVMDVFVAASLLNLRVLAAQCERQLLEWLPRLADDRDSLQAARDFGERFEAKKLRLASARLLGEDGDDVELDEIARAS